MRKLFISGCFILITITGIAQLGDKLQTFKLPDIKLNFDTLTQKYKIEKFPNLLTPRLQGFLKNNIQPTQDMPCFFPDITKVTPMPNYSTHMIGIIPIPIPNNQPTPFKKQQ